MYVLVTLSCITNEGSQCCQNLSASKWLWASVARGICCMGLEIRRKMVKREEGNRNHAQTCRSWLGIDNFTSQGKPRDRCQLSHNYQMFRPRLGPSSVLDQKVHGMVTYICKQGEEDGGKGEVGGNTGGWEYRWLCRRVFTNQCGVWG